MTEPENFEEDLFADLYTEDDEASKPAPIATEVKTEPDSTVETIAEQPAKQAVESGDGDQQMFGGDQDVDDEIDFNLGNGNGNGNGYDAPVIHEAHGPGIKEDG